MTVFLSAFLLFLVQPLLGKAILPWFGGAPAVWLACVLFFQLALLGGYLYAHWLSERFGSRAQGRAHAAVLIASLLLLPIAPSESWRPQDGGHPSARILLLLAASVGGPFLVLSATGPLVQRWFARLRPGASPYRLYALSNAGSLAALLGYPFLVEPAIGLSATMRAWSWVYGAFVVLCGSLALRVSRLLQDARAEPSVGAARVRGIDVASWLALSACGSAALLATTNRITQDVAPVPFLWVLPLAAYLGSFVLCFDRGRWYRRGAIGVLWAASLFALGAVILLGPDVGLLAQVGSHVLLLFATCMACHGELFACRPAAARLTGFFIAVAAGGALGSALVTLVAPVVFDSLAEFPLSLALGFTAWCAAPRRERLAQAAGRSFAARPWATSLRLAGALLAVAIAWTLVRRGLDERVGAVETSRSFFGVLQVRETRDRPGVLRRELVHGSIVHGAQLQDPALRANATAYYGRDSGLDLALGSVRAARGRRLRIGAIGMGAGVAAAYAGPGDELTFYELDPEVARLARRWFTYWDDAAARGARIDVVLGDGRASLERRLASGPPPAFDLLVVDAFSGDAVPVHLLTGECFDLYRRALAPDGLLAAHVSNLYLQLPSIVRRQAAQLTWEAAFVSEPPDPARALIANDWVLTGPDPALVAAAAARRKHAATWPAEFPGPRWTDDRSSLLPILR